jgi:hypothetical protein
MTEVALLLSSKMKLLPIAFALTLLVASTCAISCNKGILLQAAPTLAWQQMKGLTRVSPAR